MTIIYEDYAEEVKKRKFVKRICDRCTAEIDNHFGRQRSRYFSLMFFKQMTLDSYNSRYEEGWEVEDLCDDCVKLLKVWLLENKVKMQERTIADYDKFYFTSRLKDRESYESTHSK